jgi:hypothetical protein
MEHPHAILDEQRVIWVWQIFWSGVFVKVVQNGGFVGLGSGVPRLRGTGIRQYFMSSFKSNGSS